MSVGEITLDFKYSLKKMYNAGSEMSVKLQAEVYHEGSTHLQR
jgi:hypothetical protein